MTPVIISALLFNASVPGKAFTRALGHGVILISRSLIEELRCVLARDRFDRYVTREERDRFLVSLVRTAELVEVAEPVRECRDPKDDQILELAVSKNASCIVTGDADLLVLNPFHNVKIVTPAQLIDLLDSGASG